MRVRAGTSGYSYKEWKGNFYPADLAAAKMLSFYAGHFETVEINNTFYRMPDPKMVAKWASEVPEGFTFVLKAPQRITHQKKLAGIEDDVRALLEAASSLGDKLGPLLFQLPPWFRKDTVKIAALLALIPGGRRAALEVRHESWLSEDVYSLLRDHDAALCAADTDETPDPERMLVPTASWGYVRLRRTDYSDAQLAAWRDRIGRQKWSDAWVFFKHEDEGKGPAFAGRFKAIAEASGLQLA